MVVEASGDVVYYPGCLALNVYPGISKTSIELLKLLGVKPRLPTSVLCCGLPIHLSGVAKGEHVDAMSCFNVAKLMGNPDYVVVPCNGCYLTLKKALSSEEFKVKCAVKSKCVHIAELIWANRWKLAELAKRDLSGLKVAIHVGCHYTHAFQDSIKGEDGEDLLEDIALAFNAQVVDYEERHSCCGAPAVKWVGSILLELSQVKMVSVLNSDADVLLTMCPACMLTFDKTQYELKQLEEVERMIPVLHVSQFVALALGLDPKKTCGLHLHLANPNNTSTALNDLIGWPPQEEL